MQPTKWHECGVRFTFKVRCTLATDSESVSNFSIKRPLSLYNKCDFNFNSSNNGLLVAASVLLLFNELLQDVCRNWDGDVLSAIDASFCFDHVVVDEFGQLGSQRQVRTDKESLAARMIQILERHSCETKSIEKINSTAD